MCEQHPYRFGHHIREAWIKAIGSFCGAIADSLETGDVPHDRIKTSLVDLVAADAAARREKVALPVSLFFEGDLEKVKAYQALVDMEGWPALTPDRLDSLMLTMFGIEPEAVTQ